MGGGATPSRSRVRGQVMGREGNLTDDLRTHTSSHTMAHHTQHMSEGRSCEHDGVFVCLFASLFTFCCFLQSHHLRLDSEVALRQAGRHGDNSGQNSYWPLGGAVRRRCAHAEIQISVWNLPSFRTHCGLNNLLNTALTEGKHRAGEAGRRETRGEGAHSAISDKPDTCCYADRREGMGKRREETEGRQSMGASLN